MKRIIITGAPKLPEDISSKHIKRLISHYTQIISQPYEVIHRNQCGVDQIVDEWASDNRRICPLSVRHLPDKCLAKHIGAGGVLIAFPRRNCKALESLIEQCMLEGASVIVEWLD